MPTFTPTFPVFGSVEDLAVAVLSPLEDIVPNLLVRNYIQNGDFSDDFHTPYLLVRQVPDVLAGDAAGDRSGGDHRFVRRAVFTVQSFTDDGEDGNGEARGEALQEIALQTLLKAQREQTVVSSVGSISRLVISSPPHRASDWATGTSIVQYASLPKGMHRYEMTCGVEIRPDRNHAPDLLAPFS